MEEQQMGKQNHDELMARAKAFSAGSPRDAIGHVRLEPLDRPSSSTRST
jgi:hypothetical protein